MNKKQFVTGLVLRIIPLVIVVVAAIVIKAAGGFSADWWGWYVLYILIFACAAYAAYYGVRHGRTFVVDGVKKKIAVQTARDFLARWDEQTYSQQNVVGYSYRSERDFDTATTFGADKITVRKVLRDEQEDITGEADVAEYSYGDISALEITDIGGEGSVHIKLTLGDKEVYCYFDVDLGRYLAEKTGLTIKEIDSLKEYYLGLADEK